MAEESQAVETPPWSPKTPWLETKYRREGIGEGFELGLTCGSAYNFGKGFISKSNHSSLPPSWSSRFRNGFTYARANCLRTCGAVGGLFMIADSVENVLVYYRQKEDPVNTFAAYAAIAATVTARRGPIIASCSALGFGTVGALCHFFVDNIEEGRKTNKIDAPLS